MSHPNKSRSTTRSRRFRTAAAVGAVALTAGVAAVAVANPAQAATQSFSLYGQISAAVQPTPDTIGSQSIALTVSPSSTTVGQPIEVVVSAASYDIENGPAATAAANSEELDAVIAINGTDYTLRGSKITQAIPANGTTPYAPVLFGGGWGVSSTAGNSYSTSFDGTSTVAAGTTGIGATVRGSEATAVSLVAPGSTGTYPVTLKALVVNAIAGTSTVAVNNSFDYVINTASTGTRAAFLANTSSSYLAYSPTVDLTVT
jgi:hypothetical protein